MTDLDRLEEDVDTLYRDQDRTEEYAYELQARVSKLEKKLEDTLAVVGSMLTLLAVAQETATLGNSKGDFNTLAFARNKRFANITLENVEEYGQLVTDQDAVLEDTLKVAEQQGITFNQVSKALMKVAQGG